MSAQTLENFLGNSGITARSEARGEAKRNAEIARSMLASNFAPSDIAKFTGLTVAEIDLLTLRAGVEIKVRSKRGFQLRATY